MGSVLRTPSNNMLWCVILVVLAAYCECRSSNIINGKDVDQPGKYPWQVSLQQRNSRFHFCGGSLVAEKWVVTASHCIESSYPSSVYVTAGMHDQRRRYGDAKDYAPKRFIKHPSYRFPYNDIGLIELQSPIQFNDVVQPIELATHGEFDHNSDCVISGWGNTIGHQSSAPNILQETSIDIVEKSKCKSFARQDDVVCLFNGYSGSCNGDSGGPLACRSGAGWKLAGATSWGYRYCPVTSAYSVYADVGYFNSWIMRTSNNLS